MPRRREPPVDPLLEVIQREVHRLLAEYEARRGQNYNPTCTSDQEGEPEEEPQEPIWDEDPFEEPQEPIWDEDPFEEPQVYAEESWNTPEIEPDKVIWDDVPCMIMSPEPSETRLQLLPCGISQPQESVQPYQIEQDVTREVLLQLHSHELPGDPFDIAHIEMILPIEPQKTRPPILYSSNRQARQEYKHLSVIDIPKVDLAWTKMKNKKVSMSSASKLGPVQILLHSSVDAPSRMMVTPLPPRENDPGRVPPPPFALLFCFGECGAQLPFLL